MPGSEGEGAANRSSGTSAEGLKETTTPKQAEEAGNKVPEQRRQDINDPENPFYPDVVDLESATSSTSEQRKTFGDRLKQLIRLHKETDPEFVEDFEIDQLVKSCKLGLGIHDVSLDVDEDPVDHYIVGYPKVAAFANADPSFLIYRKFGWLHNRLLLYLQDELVALEYKLDRLDQRTFTHENDKKLKSRRQDFASPSLRRNVIKQIAEKLKEYDEHLLRFQKVQAMRRPTVRNQTSLFNFIHNTESLVETEAKWIREGVDLAAVAREEEHGWFNGFLEDTLHKISRRATQAIFRSKEQRIVTGQEKVSLVDAWRLDVALRAVLTVLAAGLLLVPVVILFELQPANVDEVRRKGGFQILTILFFTLLFSASCSIFTKARRQEVFTATAAYCAVLVVFLGNTLNTR
ncbi:MAG: hypothetical protein Q9166_004586 [cf. Caloplaca sp. 2 TL-2023]